MNASIFVRKKHQLQECKKNLKILTKNHKSTKKVDEYEPFIKNSDEIKVIFPFFYYIFQIIVDKIRTKKKLFIYKFIVNFQVNIYFIILYLSNFAKNLFHDIIYK